MQKSNKADLVSIKADLVNLEVEVDVLNMQVCLMLAFGLVFFTVSMLDDRTMSNCINFQVRLPSIPNKLLHWSQ